MDYSWAKLIGSTFALLTFAVWPWIAAFVTYGALRGVEIAGIALTLLIVGGIAAASGGRAAYALASSPGQPFSETTVAMDRDYILEHYQSAGYPNATFDFQATPAGPHVRLRT